VVLLRIYVCYTDFAGRKICVAYIYT